MISLLSLLLLLPGAWGLEEQAAAYCRTTDVDELGWDDSEPKQGLRLLEAALAANCGFEEYASPHRNVFFVKTHKTASSTLSRMVALKGLEMGVCFAGAVMDVGQNFWSRAACVERLREWRALDSTHVDMSVRHIFSRKDWWPARDCGERQGRWLEEIYGAWRAFFGDDVALVLPTRKAMSHLLSTLAYYQVDRNDFTNSTELWNPLAQDLHLLTKADVRRLQQVFEREAREKGHGFGPEGLHVIVLEQLYASLVLLRHRLRWNFRDMVTVSIVHDGDQGSGNGHKQSQPDNPFENFDYREYETLSVDMELYRALKKFMLAPWKALQARVGEASLQAEMAALNTITHNVNKLAVPLFQGDAVLADKEARKEFPLLTPLCDSPNEETMIDQIKAARRNCRPLDPT